MLTGFLELERQRVGWRFWVLWVLATNAGFFPGLAVGNRLSASTAEPYASAIVGGSFGALVGVAQWLVLRRHVAPSHHWATGTAIGWCVGAGLGSVILTRLDLSISPGGAIWTISIGFFAGAVVGIPQYRVLRRFGPSLSRWWVPISSLAWGVFFPGAISGVFLARRMSSGSAIQGSAIQWSGEQNNLPTWVSQLERLAESQGGFCYPWQSRLPSENGETAYTALVERHLAPELDVLEPGCGHGVDALRFAPRVRSYRAYDAVEGFLQVGRRAARAQDVSNVEFVHADTSPKRNAGRVRLPADSSSVDLFVSRRGPTHWILDAPRVARPGAVLLQLNPMGGDPAEWEPDLPAGLQLPEEPGSIEDRIAELLDRAGLDLSEKWVFDVPESLADPEQLYLMASWLREAAPPFEECRRELERLFERHATDEGLIVRQRRFLWKAIAP